MPVPLVAIALPGLSASISAWLVGWRGLFVTSFVAAFKEELFAVIYAYMRSDSFHGAVTELINQQLTRLEIDLQFRDVFDADKLREDLDKVAAQRVNAKAGTNFTTLKMNREEFLTEVGRVMADRVNTETGSNLATIWPVQRLRDELGTELLRQFDGSVDLNPGALFPRARVLQIQAAIERKMVGYRPPVPPIDDLVAAKNRARQKKYRRTHKQVWVGR